MQNTNYFSPSMTRPLLKQQCIAAVKIALLLSGSILSLTACTTVAPWERGNLAKAHMASNPYPMQNTARAHINSSREATATKSSSIQGGGCGCY